MVREREGGMSENVREANDDEGRERVDRRKKESEK